MSCNNATSSPHNPRSVLPEGIYTIIATAPGVVDIHETHCLACGRHLLRNGWNRRQVYLDLGQGRAAFKVRRKKCPQCGEVHPDYSAMWARNRHYHDNYPRRARQHYMAGLPPGRIQEALEVDFGMVIPRSTIARWVDEVAAPLRDVLAETPVPTSGTWAYDEIFLKVKGERSFCLVAADPNTEFIVSTRASESMGKSAGRQALMEARRVKHRVPQVLLNSLVMDGTTNLGKTLHEPSFKRVSVQRCKTHFKWTVAKAVKQHAGLPKESKKPLPPEYHPLLQRFYRVLDAGSEGEAYVALEALRPVVEQSKSKVLLTALKQVENSLPKILAHLRVQDVPDTNNFVENLNQDLERMLTFKRRMMTLGGAQRAADYRTFRHNYRLFPKHADKLRKKYSTYRSLLADDPADLSLRGMGNYFKFEWERFNKWEGKYHAFWTQYLARSQLGGHLRDGKGHH